VQTLLDRASNRDGYTLTVSLEENTISDTEAFKTSFGIDPFRRDCLLEGLDDIGLTLRHAAELDTYEQQHDAAFWVKPRAGEQAQA
jgi:3-isopropylmalate/(R)-2-methylmalate dehydratase small subunit